MPADALVLTLIGPDGQRHQPCREVLADADEPRTLLPHLLEMVANIAEASAGRQMPISPSEYETEVALSDSGRVLYILRCM